MQDEITKAIVAAIEPQLYAAEMAETVPIAERAALGAVEADREDAWAHHRLAYTYLFRRRFDDALANAQSKLRDGARLLRPDAVLRRTMAGAMPPHVVRCG